MASKGGVGAHEQADRELARALAVLEENHSLYGIDVFRTVKVAPDTRDKVAAAIGVEAEHLAFLYCAVGRESLYDNLQWGGPPYSVRDRRDGTTITLRGVEGCGQLFTIDLANHVEQMPHSPGSRERFAKNRRRYLAAVPLLPPSAVEEPRRTHAPRAAVLARRVARWLRRVVRR